MVAGTSSRRKRAEVVKVLGRQPAPSPSPISSTGRRAGQYSSEASSTRKDHGEASYSSAHMGSNAAIAVWWRLSSGLLEQRLEPFQVLLQTGAKYRDEQRTERPRDALRLEVDVVGEHRPASARTCPHGP